MPAVEALVQAALEAETTEAIGAAKGERSETRLSQRSGYYSRSLIIRVGTLRLRVPQDPTYQCVRPDQVCRLLRVQRTSG